MNRRRLFWGILAAFSILSLMVVVQSALSQQSAEDLYEAALLKKEAEGDLNGAINLFQSIVTKYPDRRDFAAKAQFQIGICYEKLGLKQAQEAFQKVIEKYPDQSEVVKAAREKLALLARPREEAEKGDKELKIRRVYGGDELKGWNSLSSDGRHLIYTDWSTGDLAVIDIVNGQHRPLTDKGPWTKSSEWASHGAYSPDDKRIAYGWMNQNQVRELRVIGFDGSNPRVLYRNEQCRWIQTCEWTPDGKHILILITHKEGPGQIALVSASDGTIRILGEVQAEWPSLDLSPDGRYIACSMVPEPTSSKSDVFIVKTESGEISPLVANAADDYALGWAPDGRRLLFASDRTGAYGAWSLVVSDGRAQGPPKLIKADFNKANPVRLTPDGVLYYVQEHMLSDVYIAAIDPDTGKVQGTPVTAKVRYSGANASPDWSPDGTRLVYRTNPGGMDSFSAPAMISVLDVRTGEERQITPKLDAIGLRDGPRWAPDGRSVLVIGRRGEERGVYQVDIENGATSPLVIVPERTQFIFHAVWSLDAKSIFYFQGKPLRILRRDLDTGRDTELAMVPDDADVVLALSPDGKWLAFAEQKAPGQMCKLNLVPSAGGEARELFRGQGSPAFSSTVNWTPDGRFLWFEKHILSKDPKAPPKIECWRVSPDGGNLQKLELNYQGSQLRLSPDGRQIAFWTRQDTLELWAMENFLPKEKK
jgi:Tol biopolymer transport system component